MKEPEKSAGKAVCGETTVAAELGNSLDADPKTLKDESEAPRLSSCGVLVENSRENGVRVSTNGKEVLDDRLDGKVVETDKTRVLETEISVGNNFGSSGEEVGLEDSEMNGVSSLLKMREGGERKGFGSFIDALDEKEEMGNEKVVPAGLTSSGNGVSFLVDITGSMNNIADNESRDFDDKEDMNGDFEQTSERKDGQGDEVGDEGYEFHVGDFVWGKIRSHPWWPGQIYDLSDASDFALKVKQKGRLLVAYFGDGTFAWCHPSQLIPFEDNFEEMSKMSNSRNFINAVQKAVDEMGRQVELLLTCSCVPKENLNGTKRPLAENAGIKEGIAVPEGGTRKLAESLFQPTKILAEVRHLAKGASLTNFLEYAVLKSQLSAFYRTKGGYQLPVYHEPHLISGLEEEETDSGINRSDEYNAMEVPIQGPVEEDWISSFVDLKFEKTCQSLLHQCSGVSEDGRHQRRKQKSIAEIMEGEKIVQAKKEGSGGKEASSSVSKKRKGSSEADGNLSATSMSAPRKKKVTELSGSHTATESAVSSVENDGGGPKEKVQGGPSTRGRRSKDSTLENTTGGSKEETYMSHVSATREGPSTRGRKKEGSTSGNDGIGDKTETSDNPLSKLKKKKKQEDNSRFQDDDCEANEQTERDHLPRERKKSRYLSPPYTDPNQSHVRSGDRTTKSVDDLIGSPPILKASAEASSKKISKELDGHKKTDNLSPQTPKEDQNEAIDSSKVKASVNKVVTKIRSVALSPQYVKEDSSIDMVEDFLSAFRSSIYRNGSNYKMYNQSTRKRKLVDSEPESSGVDQNQTEQRSLECHATRVKIKKSEKTKTEKIKCKQASKGLDLETNELETNGQDPSAELFVTFGPGSSLPSKNDLITIYEKYGPLDKEETGMFHDNCARLVFLRSSDATKAFNSSQSASPFGATSKVTFHLCVKSAASKVRELKDIPNPKPSPRSKERDKIVPNSKPSLSYSKEGGKTENKPSASRSNDGEGSQLDYIRQKLEMMTSMLEKSDGKMSQQIKSKLEAEMKGLLKEVSTMVESSS
ncbi:uncharacterized protein LOC110826162 [Carica papaya]|uniref:uncharacterized protein LOC110826162 n=1 Tax=Carica papaya TaxID=3649 RepID=UPI000B8C9A4D|nr:uncharacterized protein LOC110826162 [Carica papaya]